MMKKILLIGASGFVGRHLGKSLENISEFNLVRCSSRPSLPDYVHLDLNDNSEVKRIIQSQQPDIIINLSAISSPNKCRKLPDCAWKMNTQNVFNLAKNIVEFVPSCLLLHISSGMVYGEAEGPERAFKESDHCNPYGAYASSKYAGELAIKTLAESGLRALIVRPFNHSGPGQSDDFALPSFAKQIIEAKLRENKTITVGDLSSFRDFLSVYDVCDAYIEIIRHVDNFSSGEVINVCSGAPVMMRHLLDRMIILSGANVRVEERVSVGTGNISVLVGKNRKLLDKTNWTQRTSHDELLMSLLGMKR